MTTEIYRALEILRQANNLLECAFWAAESLDDRRAALTTTIMEAQDKLGAAMALLNGEGTADKSEREAA
jgi:hypothetical protein